MLDGVKLALSRHEQEHCHPHTIVLWMTMLYVL